MPDYSTAYRQATELRDLLLADEDTRERQIEARQAAWRWLAHEPQGQMILTDLAAWLIQPSLGNEGREVILKIFAAVRGQWTFK